MADGVDFVKTIECVIFIVSFMIWGGFLVFVVAAYKVHKLHKRVIKLTQELQELRTKPRRQSDIVRAAISMFRDVKYTLGYDPSTPIGRIANVARRHWFEVQALQAKAHWQTLHDTTNAGGGSNGCATQNTNRRTY